MPRNHAVCYVVVNPGYAGWARRKVLEHSGGSLLVLHYIPSKNDAPLQHPEVLGKFCELFAANGHELSEMDFNAILSGPGDELNTLSDCVQIPCAFF